MTTWTYTYCSIPIEGAYSIRRSWEINNCCISCHLQGEYCLTQFNSLQTINTKLGHRCEKKEGGYKIKMKKLYFNVYVSRSAILVGGILLDVRRNQTFFKDIVIWRLNLIWDGWMVYYGDKRTTLWNWKSKKFCTKNNFFRDLKKMRQRRIIQSKKCRIARNCTFMVNVECAKSL